MTKQAADAMKIDLARDFIMKQAEDAGVDINALAEKMGPEEVGRLLSDGLAELQEAGVFDEIDANVDSEPDEEDGVDVVALAKLAETDPERFVALSQDEEFLGKLAATVAMVELNVQMEKVAGVRVSRRRT